MKVLLRRAVGAAVFLTLVTSLVAPTAGAEPPVVFRPEIDETSVDVLAEISCDDFGVRITPLDGSRSAAIFFADGRAFLFAPASKYEVSANGMSVVVNGTGSFHDDAPVIADDGTFTQRSKATGHNLLFGIVDGEPTMRYYVGRVIAEFSGAVTDDGLEFGPEIDVIDDSRARMIDLCERLAP